MRKPNYCGSYLITHEDFVFSDSPEIFLLLQDNELSQPFGVCLNKPILVSVSPDTVEPLTYGLLAEVNKDFDVPVFANRKQLSVLNGGPDSKDLFVLHTGLNKVENLKCQKYVKDIYYLSEANDFIDLCEKNTLPDYLTLIRGRHNFDMPRLSENIASKKWELRSGMHAMAYGILLNEKLKNISILSQMQQTSSSSEIFPGAGGFFDRLKTTFDEASISLMFASVRAFYITETNLTDDQILEAARMSIAISEAEANNVIETMEHYTHEDILTIYEMLLKRRFEFKILDRFDRQNVALKEFGLTYISYHIHVAQSVYQLKKNSGRNPISQMPNTRMSSKAENLKRNLVQFAEIVKKNH